MAKIALEGMKFYAYHGYYPEEQIIGGYYIVDVYVEAQVMKAAVKDDLKQTVNYESIYHICRREMRQKSKLIETVAERISMGIKHQFGFLKEIKVRVRKLNPPLPGQVDSSFVEVDGSFSKRCGRCSRPLLCYGDRSCWCMDTHVYQKQLEQLQIQFGNNCLCKECLGYYMA